MQLENINFLLVIVNLSQKGFKMIANCGEKFNEYWPANLHLIGKDIIRFHTIYWPIFLMALDLPLPKQVFGHPWLLQGDGKMSKSKGNVLYADELVEFFGVDGVRYFVLHEMPFDNDGVITWELMVERLNTDLANTLGNLVNRTISMSNKYFGGVVTNAGAAEEVDEDLKAVVLGTADSVSAKMDQLRVADAMTDIFSLFRRCNKYIDETMPWALAKDEAKKDRLATVLYNLVESISIGASLLESFMPETAAKVVAQLNTTLRSLEETKTFGLYPSGNKVVEKPEILFARLDVNEVLEKVAEKKAAEEAANHVPTVEIEAYAEENIDFDTFCKSDFRAVKVKECSEVKKSKKLLHFVLDDGTGTDRIILSGIREFYNPEDLVGKTLLAITNLPPRKMMGIESCGMLMSAVHNEDGVEKLNLVMLNDAIPAGAKLC